MTNQNTFQFRLIDTHGEELALYKELHNIFFKGASVTKEWINWYHNKIGYLDNQFSGTRTYAAFDGDKLIGIWSVEPKLLCTGDSKTIKIGRCFAVGIHPDYRRMGLFVSLSKYSIKQEREKGEFEYILGFPQVGRSVVGGHLKAGWEIVQEIGIHSICPSEANKTASKSTVEVLTDFNSMNSFNCLQGSFKENANYKNLRWINHPDLQYICLKYEDSHIVLKPYSNFCHIVDLNGNAKYILKLLEASITLGKRHGWIELNLWCADNSTYLKQIEKAGFNEGANNGLPVQLIAVKINAKTSLELDYCHFSMGVEEGY